MTVRHQFVWNSESFRTAADECAIGLFESALRGLIQIPAEGESAALYCDDRTPLLQRNISKGKTVGDFVEYLNHIEDQDLSLVLAEIDDKADAINSLPDDQITALAESAFYFESLGYVHSIDFLGLAATIDGILFSAASEAQWTSHEIRIGSVSELELGGEPGFILSVCSTETAKRIIQLLRPAAELAPLEELAPRCVISEELLNWFNELQEENQNITRKKLVLASEKNFQGGEPLFKTLNNADGMREIRFNAYPGGAGRVLFGSLGNGKIALLRGFIKKGNNEGYSENIPPAKNTWEAMKANVNRA